ncbi:MAG: cysteine desulfurase [Candidatus Hydrogenedentes bacterium]|nr:cysteine desulfurase [Candidatus Hydrogenedentota bacterium]
MGLETLRSNFPILGISVRGKPLVYLDNAATTQKPQMLIDAVNRYYSRENANVHRGIHYLSEKLTDRYEEVRTKVRGFIGAKVDCEIVFTKGTTEGINLIASSFALPRLKQGDEILVTYMEHHSNLIPWQIVAQKSGAKLRVLPITDDGLLDLSYIDEFLSDRTKIFAFTYVSNVLGTINPVRDLTKRAHEVGAVVIIDGAQAIAHLPVNVQEIDCDFFVASGHKMYGPTGIGILYGKAPILSEMEPYQTGGSMILNVKLDNTIYAHIPHKFEAGTPNIEGVIGLGSAIDFLNSVGMYNISAYEEALVSYAYQRLLEVPGINIVGPFEPRTGVLSFTMDCAHPHDISQILDEEGIAIRAGHHCAQPLMERLGLPATARASFAIYNSVEEVDLLIKALHKVRKIFG